MLQNRKEKWVQREKDASIEADGIRVVCLGKEIEVEQGGEKYRVYTYGKVEGRTYSERGREGDVERDGSMLCIRRQWVNVDVEEKVED